MCVVRAATLWPYFSSQLTVYQHIDTCNLSLSEILLSPHQPTNQPSGPVPVVLVHGMGACHEHFNKLLDELDGNRYTAYALDLLGFGDSDKPCPSDEASQQARGHLYNYNTWAQQLEDFVQQVWSTE